MIVVNDGSIDRTQAILLDMKRKSKFILITYKKNKGKGFAVKKGVSVAKGTHVTFMDVDLSTPPQTLDDLYKKIGNADVMIGTRKHTESILSRRQSFVRETMGKFFTALSRLVLDVGVSDFTCGFKCFTKESAKKIFKKQKIQKWAFDGELLFLAKKYNYSIVELPVVWNDVSGTKVRFPQDAIFSFIDLFRIRLNDLRERY